MKILFEDYSFNAAAKQVTLNAQESISLERMLLVTNVTDNVIIYNFADPAKGGTISNNVLTLDFDTSGMSDSDRLQIFLENSYTPASQETLQELNDQTILLRRITKLLEPSANQDSAGRQNVTIGGGTLPTVTTVSTVTGVTTVSTVTGVTTVSALTRADNYLNGGAAAASVAIAESAFVLQSRIAFATLRQNIQFS